MRTFEWKQILLIKLSFISMTDAEYQVRTLANITPDLKRVLQSNLCYANQIFDFFLGYILAHEELSAVICC